MTVDKTLFSNKKYQNFLSFLRDEIILQEPDNKTLKIVCVKYKELLSVFDDYDEIRKYLQYLEKQELIKLKHISKQRIKNKKIPDNTYFSKITPDNELLSGDEFYEVMRYHKINYYPEDLFIFEYDRQKIQQTLNKEKEMGTTNFRKEVLETEKLLDKLESDIERKTKRQEQFEIQVKDRYIWINNYLLSKPHAVGSNFEFFEYIRLQPAHTKIERKNLPSKSGDLSIKEQVKNKSFIKILNALGFKGEILKTFFPKRGKNIIVYRGDKITKKDLEKSGIKMPLFLKELELAHIKNSPE